MQATPRTLARWGLIAAFVVAGCVPTLNPIYTDKDLVFDPAVLGNWVQEKSAIAWTFTQRDDTSYDLVYTDQEGREAHFIARLAKIEDTTFLDLYPKKPDLQAADFYRLHLVPIHTVYRIEATGSAIQLGIIDGNWLQSYLDEHPEALAHTQLERGLLITAPTPELQTFLVEHKDKFSGDVKLVPAKKPAM